jgi:hypothetical protein
VHGEAFPPLRLGGVGKVRFLTGASERCLHAGLAHWPVGWICRRFDFSRDVGGAANMTREMFRSLTVR